MISHYVTAALVKSVAREYRKGRRLLVATTNMDAQRSVIWDMGAIASSDRPDALPLFRNILIASASIPGAFPPIQIKVRANGRSYDEMHLDGASPRRSFSCRRMATAQSRERRPVTSFTSSETARLGRTISSSRMA